MDNRAFLYQEAPPGYVAGVGRGATGFVTTADSGALLNAANDDNELQDDVLTNDKDDEADRVYADVEKRIQSRRKQVVVVEDPKKESESRFIDLKRALSQVTDDQWASIPEAADLTRRNKRLRLLEQSRQRFYATPDSILAGAGNGTTSNTTDFESLSQTRDKLLGAQLDSLVSTKETEITEELIENSADADKRLADIQKNRAILASLRKTDPYNAFSWISSAALEVQARNYTAAKRLITEGCSKVPHDEEIWLENIQIHLSSSEGAKMCKMIVTEALRFNSKSEKLWLRACGLENPGDFVSQRRVLMKGIEYIPDSAALWRKMIDLEDDKSDVKKLLAKAVEFCPKEWDFWLTLINLSQYEEAKSVLNKARKNIQSSQVWTVACKLEERQNPSTSWEKLAKLVGKGVSQLGSSLSRRDWLKEAAKAEKEKFHKTCRAIVTCSLSIGEEEDRLQVCFDEAEYFSGDSPETSNYIYQYAIDKYPNDIEVWLKFFGIIKAQENTDIDTIYGYYRQAIDLNPQESIFRLMYAKELWRSGNDPDGARAVLQTAVKQLPDDESIWHAQIKLEAKTGNYDQAKSISENMTTSIPQSSSRVWYKHIHLLRCLNSIQLVESYETTIVDVLENALSKFPECDKLYLQKAQVLVELKKNDEARETLVIGTNKVPGSETLWINLARMDEQVFKVLIRARSVLDRAIFKNPKSDRLWEEKIRLERRHNDVVVARQLCNKALKSFKESPRLWIQHLSLIPKMSHRKNGFLDALKETNNSPIILLNIGIFFWADGKISKAKSWFERSFQADKSNGDVWGWLYNFFKQHSDEKDLTTLESNFEKHLDDITSGETWNEVNKSVENFNKKPGQLLQLVAQTLKTNTS